MTVSLRVRGKKLTTTVQRLVLEAFVGPPPTAAHEANHKNGTKSDNCPSNLEWVTRQENMDHAWGTGLCKPRQKKELPPIDAGPTPGDLWQTVTVHVYVPTSGRCDQHAAVIDSERVGLLSATEIGRKVAAMLCKRPSFSMLAETMTQQ